jgi:GH24 family phage-related lysozyme (muramidase)
LQLGLAEAGHAQEADGRFGSDTEKAVKAFQLSQRLLDNGIVGKATWKALDEPIQRALGSQRERIAEHLPGFDGDPGWVHLLEGHRGQPYWPGGASGVTLDPGIDLGHADAAFLDKLLRDHYGELMSPEQRAAVEAVVGIQGDDAKAALTADAVLGSIRISQEHADRVFPVASAPYWAAITERFERLSEPETPPSVQTALLSLAYNRGADNRHLESLGLLLADRDWVAAADKIGSMQQSHKLEGIRRRRREEAALIRAELECLQA